MPSLAEFFSLLMEAFLEFSYEHDTKGNEELSAC